MSDASGPPSDWSRAPLGELADHIERTHHVYLRREMPRIADLIETACREHGGEHPWLPRLRDAFATFQKDMLEHLDTEERDVMPGCRRLGQGLPLCDPSGCERSIRGPLKVMIEQHDQCGMMLQRMAELTNQFAQAGADGPPAITEALSALSSMERDTRQHVYKENCLLAFRAEQAETSLRARKPRG